MALAEKDLAILKDAFKLSLYESKAYVALLQGASDSKSISRLGRIPLPRIYDTLRSLEVKGFVARNGEGYVPVSPKIALEGRLQQFESEFQQEKTARIDVMQNLLQRLKVQHREESAGEVALIRGINSIANKFSDVFAKSNSVILTVRKAFEARELFMRYVSSEAKKKKEVRIIVPAELKIPEVEFSTLGKMRIEIKKHEDILLDLMVSDTDDVMIGVPDPLSDEPFHAIAIWTRNSSFAQSLRNSLDDLWRKAKNVKGI
jgi:sugar-specific transcriptional regulator TrmB